MTEEKLISKKKKSHFSFNITLVTFLSQFIVQKLETLTKTLHKINVCLGREAKLEEALYFTLNGWIQVQQIGKRKHKDINTKRNNKKAMENRTDE